MIRAKTRPSGRIHVGRLARRTARTGSERFHVGKAIASGALVVILYDGARPDPALVKLQKDVAGPFDAELAAAGQAVILAPRQGAGPATALAWNRILRADPSDPALHEFAEFWLGRGIP